MYHSSWLAKLCAWTESCPEINERYVSISFITQHPHQPGQPRQDARGNTGILYCQWRQRSEEVILPSRTATGHLLRKVEMDFLSVKHCHCVAFRAFFYCKACHDDITDPKRIKKCGCKRREYSRFFILPHWNPSFPASLPPPLPLIPTPTCGSVCLIILKA